jgi:hypothetical protein
MAIDARIALGVQPVQQQPNMLAQYAQVMGIKAAQQEMEGNNALREAYASGGDLNDPEFRRRVMAANPRVGSQLIKTNAETGKLQNEAILKRIDLSREMLTGVNTPEDYLSWHESNHKDPVLGGYLNQRGVTAEQSRAKIIAALNTPGGLEKLKRESALGATALQKELMQTERSVQTANISAGPAYGQLTLAREKAAKEQQQLNAVLGIVSPAPVSSATATPIDMGGGGVQTSQTPSASGVQTPAAGAAPVTPPVGTQPTGTGDVGQPNVLATQVAPQPVTTPTQTNVNAFNTGSQKEQLVDQISRLARLPYVDASRALEMKVKEFNVLYPTEKIEQDRQGNLVTVVNGVAKPVLDLKGLPVQGKPLPETAFEKSVGAEVGKDVVAFVKRVEAAPKNITKIDEALSILKSGGAVTGFGAESRLNLERAMSLFGNDVKAGKRVVDTQILDALLGSDVFPSLQSMGLGSKNIDTPAEREYIRQVITGTIQLDNDALIRLTQIRRNVETNAIKEYNQKLESGKFDKYSKAAGQKLEKIEIPNPIIRQGRHKNGRLVIERADGTLEYGN